MNSVVIDFLPQNVERYRDDYAIVAVDVIRATTTLMTAISRGRRCYVADSVDSALACAARLEGVLLAGELSGDVPPAFHLSNSPAALVRRADVERPMVLVSSSGTQLLCSARGCAAVYIGCFRNHRAVADHIAGRHARIAVIGAGTRGEFREEDQMCCSWIAARLVDCGYRAEAATLALVSRWKDAPVESCLVSKSVDYLTRTGQVDDLEFVLSHVNDLDLVGMLVEDEVVIPERSPESRRPGTAHALVSEWTAH
jgi:2-phosphosulfolactate phosphatase